MKLSDDARRLVELSRGGHGPTREQKARLKSALLVTASVAAATATTTASTAATGSSTFATQALGLKMALTFALALGGGAVGTLALRHAAQVRAAEAVVASRARVEQPPRVRQVEPQTAVVEPAPRVREVEPLEGQGPALVEPIAVVVSAQAGTPAPRAQPPATWRAEPGPRPEPAMVAPAARRPQVESAPEPRAALLAPPLVPVVEAHAPVVVSAPSPEEPAATAARAERPASPEPHRAASSGLAVAVDSTVSDELKHLQDALDSMKNQHSDEALETLERYEQKFPRGVMRLEARALKVRALCASGSTAPATALAAELLGESPDSPAVKALRGTCASAAFGAAQ